MPAVGKRKPDEWTYGNKVRLYFPSTKKWIVAENCAVLGEVAVHQKLKFEEVLYEYSVTHVKTGLNICRLSDLVDAIKVAEFVWGFPGVKEAYENTDGLEVARATPRELVEWLRYCRSVGKFSE